jgi:hypothetical protein
MHLLDNCVWPVLSSQAAAAAQSAHDRAEAQASTWKAESRALREKLQASEKVG